MTADDALTSKVRVERKLWGRIPQPKTLGKVFSLHKSKVETRSNTEHEKRDAREDDVTTEVNRSTNLDSSIGLGSKISIKDQFEREKSPDEEDAVGDGSSVATGITATSGRSRRSTRREKSRRVPLSSRSMSHRTSSNASSKFSGTRDDLSNAYSVSTRMTSRYSSDEDDDQEDDDPGLPFSAFDSTIDALRALMGDVDDNSCPSYSDSSSDSESECDSAYDSIGGESKSVASCTSEGSLHAMTTVPNVSISVDKDKSTNKNTKISDDDEMSAVITLLKLLAEDGETTKKNDTATSSKDEMSVGGQGSSHPRSISQNISGRIERTQSDATGFGSTSGSISVEVTPFAERREDDMGALKSNSFDSSNIPKLSAANASTRHTNDPELSTDDLVEVSLNEFQTVRAEMLDPHHAPSQLTRNHRSGPIVTSPSHAEESDCAIDRSGTETAMPTVGPSRANMARYNWLRGLGGPLSRKAGARKLRTVSTMPAKNGKISDVEHNGLIDQAPGKEENEKKNNGGDSEGMETVQVPLLLDERGDKSVTSIGEEVSPLEIMTLNNSNTTTTDNQGEQSTGPKTKAKPSLFARLDKIGRKNSTGRDRRLGATKLEIDNIPIVPTGSTREAQDCLQSDRNADNLSSVHCDSGLSVHDLSEGSINLENVPTGSGTLPTPGSNEVEAVEMDLTSFSMLNSTPLESPSVTHKEVDDSSTTKDEQQRSIEVRKSQSIDAVADERVKSAAVDDETRDDNDGEIGVELPSSTLSQVELRESLDIHPILANNTDNATDSGSFHPEICLSSMFCCFFPWESKEPIMSCQHCQKPILARDDRVEDDIGDPRCGVTAEFHYDCHEEREKLKEKKKKVIRQIRLFGHLKRKHLRRQRTLRKHRAMEEEKKSKNESRRHGHERKVDEQQQNPFVARVLRRVSSRDGTSTPSRTRHEGRNAHDDTTTRRRQRRVDTPKTRQSQSPNRTRKQGHSAGVVKTRQSVSPARRDRGHDDTNKYSRRRLREGSPSHSYYQQRGDQSSKSMIKKKVEQDPISPQRSRSLSRRPSLIPRQPTPSPLRKVRFAGASTGSISSHGRSRSGSPQRMERQRLKRNKSVLGTGGSLLKRTLSSSRASTSARHADSKYDDLDYGINLEDFKVVKIKGIV